MPISSPLAPETIVGNRPRSIQSAQSFISGGSPLGNSVVSRASNNIVGFQRASVRPATPDLNSIVSTISSNILNQVSNKIESVTNISNRNVDAKIERVRSEVTREIQPLYSKQENNTTQLQNIVQNINQRADSTIGKIIQDYRKKVSEVDDAKPTGILGNFLKVFKDALDFIQFFGSKKNLDNIESNLTALQKTFSNSFEVAKLIRETINKIVAQLSNLPTATPSGSPGLNIDLNVPRGGLKQSAPRGIGNVLKKGGMFALGAGGLAAGAGVVNALSDTGVTPVQQQPGMLGGLVEGLGNIVSAFTAAVDNLISGGGTSGGGGSSGGGGGGGGGKPSSPSPSPSPSPSGNLNAGDITADTAEEKAFIATVREAEGTAGAQGYNTVYGGAVVPQLTEMTLQELYDASKLGGTNRLPQRLGGGVIPYAKDKYNSSASGAAQLMPDTLKGLVESGKFSWDQKFSPETQNSIILALARQGGVNIENIDANQLRKANNIWAGLGPRYGQTKRTIDQSLKMYQENLKEAKGSVKPVGMGGPETPDWVLSPEKREELKNMATTVAQPPPSQATPSVNVLPIDLSTSGQQAPASSGSSPSSGVSSPPGSTGPTAPFLPSGNPDNFLVLYSRIVYNIVDG